MFLEIATKRRSIRKYKKKKVEKEKIDYLIEATLRSPSGKSIYPCEFIVISDNDLLEKLSKSKKHGASFLKDAPLGILVCADKEKTDVYVEDASITSIFIHLAATSLDLGSCWIQIRKRMYNDEITSEKYISKLLKIPQNIMIESIVAVGYPDEEKPYHEKNSLNYNKVSYNFFGNKTSSIAE